MEAGAVDGDDDVVGRGEFVGDDGGEVALGVDEHPTDLRRGVGGLRHEQLADGEEEGGGYAKCEAVVFGGGHELVVGTEELPADGAVAIGGEGACATEWVPLLVEADGVGILDIGRADEGSAYYGKEADTDAFGGGLQGEGTGAEVLLEDEGEGAGVVVVEEFGAAGGMDVAEELGGARGVAEVHGGDVLFGEGVGQTDDEGAVIAVALFPIVAASVGVEGGGAVGSFVEDEDGLFFVGSNPVYRSILDRR